MKNYLSGLERIPPGQVDSRPDDEIIEAIQSYRPVSSEKNIWAFWHNGWSNMRSWTQRNVIAWARRLEPLGWTVRVLDMVPGSPRHVSNFLDMQTFPAAFQGGAVGGPPQHLSDLIRLPLVYEHGGCWIDVTTMIFGNLEEIWDAIQDPETPYSIGGYVLPGRSKEYEIFGNSFIVAKKGDAFLIRWHSVYAALWEGRTSTKGMHTDPLISWLGLFDMDGLGTDEDNYEARRVMTDYLAQMMCFERLMLLEDPSDGFSGRRYWEKIFMLRATDELLYAHHVTEHMGERLHELLTSPQKVTDAKDPDYLPEKVVNHLVANTFSFKVFHGFGMPHISLGEIWDRPENKDVDIKEGTLIAWMRYAEVNLRQTRKLVPAKPDRIPDDYVVRVGVSERAPLSLTRRRLK